MTEGDRMGKIRKGIIIFAAAVVLSLAAFIDSLVFAIDPASIPDNQWVRIYPKVVLPGNLTGTYHDRGWTMAAYDQSGKRVLVYEGFEGDGYGPSIYSNSIWAFDPVAETLTLLKLNHWYNSYGGQWDYTTVAYPENASDPTPADRHPAFTYVSDRNSIYTFTGLNFRIDGIAPNHPDDTWRFDLGTQSWEEIFPAVHPVVGRDATWPAMEYDPSTRRMVIANAPIEPYGTRYTWLFNIDSGNYERIDSTYRPDSQGGNSMSYDSRRKLVWLFGGGNYDSGGNELWRLDVAQKSWTQVVQSGAVPPRRIYHGFVYIHQYDTFFLYGGSTAGSGGTPLTDTWVYSAAESKWTQLNTNSPTPGTFADMAYDKSNDLVVVQTNGEWWVFRYKPDTAPTLDNTPPSPPENVSVQ